MVNCAPVSAIVFHDDQPSETPSDNLIGRWGSNASCVAIAPNLILSVKHQGGDIGTNIIIGPTTYKVTQLFNLSVDLRVARITTISGSPANLSEYVTLYTGTSETGQEIFLAGYGRGRGTELQTGGDTYGYTWATETNSTLRWATNIIDGNAIAGTPYGNTYILIADFDDLAENMTTQQIKNHNPTENEGIPAEYDSGGAWFLHSSGELIAMTAYLAYDREQSWFRNNVNPFILEPDPFYGIQISSYENEITPVITWMSDYVIISGYAFDSRGNPLNSATINTTGGAGYTKTDSTGHYEIWVENGWSGNISASKTGYNFTPSSTSFADISQDSNNNDFIAITVITDDFNDNIRSAMWINNSDDLSKVWINETNNQLELNALGTGQEVSASYASNEWALDTTANFSTKLDYHHSVADTNDNMAYLKLISDPNNYAYIAIGSNIDGQYCQIEVVENSDVNELSNFPITASDGTLYIYYSSSNDRLYLSLSDYGTTSNGLYAENAVAKSWINGKAKIEIATISNNCEILPGEMSFDNFTVNTGTILDWPPSTDIDQSGFIDYNDLKIISTDWLFIDTNSPADITDDNNVNFADFAKFSNAW